MKFSIIIPAFNCADTIEEAVKSITSQSFNDYEIIIIDDGSTDFTPDKIDELKLSSDKIKAIRTKNSGPAKARNKGIAIASGEFVMFLDSDDIFEENALQTISDAIKTDTELLIFGFRQTFDGKAKDIEYSPDKTDDISVLYKKNLLNQVWNKAYNRKFILERKIEFSDYRYGEDRIFNASVISCLPVSSSIPDILYNYRIDKSVSLISGYIPDKFDACKLIYDQFSYFCSDKEVPRYMFMKNILSCMTVLWAENCTLSSKEKNEEIKKILLDETVKSAMDKKIGGFYSEVIRKIIRSGNVQLNRFFARTVAFCQKHFLPLFLIFRK